MAATLPVHAEEAAIAAESGLFSPEGYRLRDYRAPVPETAPGAQTITLDTLKTLQAEGAILVDVMGLQQFYISDSGTWITSGEHLTIPGAVWLPVVGWGAPEAWQDRYLDDSLAVLTGGDRAARIAVFCKFDCWLSWNTARRLAERGYTHVLWFPGGTDLWGEAGLPLVAADPYPVRLAE